MHVIMYQVLILYIFYSVYSYSNSVYDYNSHYIDEVMDSEIK